jgi:hypothetical protein
VLVRVFLGLELHNALMMNLELRNVPHGQEDQVHVDVAEAGGGGVAADLWGHTNELELERFMAVIRLTGSDF